MKRKRMEVSIVIKFKDLPITGLAKGEWHPTKYFVARGRKRYIRWYPLGHERAKEGYCSIFLSQEKAAVERDQWSFELEVDNEFKVMSFIHTFDGVNPEWGAFNFLKLDAPPKAASLSVEVERRGFQRWNLFKEIIGKMNKDIRLDVGSTSILGNSSVLRFSSPVFKAMLNSESGYIEQKENCIKIEGAHEEYFKEFIDFLHAEKIAEINIEKSADLKKIVALVTLAVKYQVNSLLEYLLCKITDSPSKKDISNRLEVLALFKRISTYRKSGESLMAWVQENMNTKEVCEIMSKFLFSTEIN